jgi:hypothetical protein
LTTDYRGSEPTQSALIGVWKSLEEGRCSGHTDERIAQELKPLVVIPLRASMGQRPTQQIGICKLIT